MNIPREAVSALAHKLRNGDWNLRAPQELADMIASELDALSEHGGGGEAVALDYVPGRLDREAPPRVWLQIDTSASNDERDEAWPGAEHVTWQDESIGGLEIQYVRADLATTPPTPSAPTNLVPGVMACAKCKFRLVRTNLYVRNGTTGPGDNATEPCPNGCGPLWPVSWEQEARECWQRLEEMAAPPSAPVVDEAMARRYLSAQKAYVAQIDAAFGRQVAGALHQDDVVAACMAGLTAALSGVSAPVGDALLRDLRMIAEQGEMPDGDGVPVNVRLWAEKHIAALTPPAAAPRVQMNNAPQIVPAASEDGLPCDALRAIRALTEHEWVTTDGGSLLAAEDIAITIRRLAATGQEKGNG